VAKDLKSLVIKLGNLAHLDMAPLRVEVEAIIVEGNRRGILSGLDSAGVPLAKTTYRNSRARFTPGRKGARKGTRKGRFQGLGALANGNLTSAEYRRLDGPPLAPRREQSRVITNFVTRSSQDADGALRFQAGWADVVSVKGIPFLPFHFAGSTGKRRLPRRNLVGIRPVDQIEIRKAIRDHFAAALRR
jgi:hypothetical protein